MSTRENQYDIEAVVSIDSRGQIVLPKEVRAELQLEGGSKLAVVVMRSRGIPCCINLVPAQALAAGVRKVIEAVGSGEGAE